MDNGFGSISDLLKKPTLPTDGGVVPSAPSTQTAPTVKKPTVTEVKYEEKMHALDVQGEERTTEERARMQGLPYMNLDKFPIGPETLKLVPEVTAQTLAMIPFYRSDKEVRLGAVDPTNEEVQAFARDLEGKLYVLVQLYYISAHSVASALKIYATLPIIRDVPAGVSLTEDELKKYQEELKNFKDLQTKAANAPVTDIVAMIFAGALGVRASDVHVEAEELEVKIRYRIDGILHDAATLPKTLWTKLINRVKLLSGLKLNVTDKPQDGRFTIHLKDGKVDVRVSVLPTAYGESIVIRLLMSNVKSLTFEDLGIRGRAYEQMKRKIEEPTGMILTTGPTGSGKTTTLYAILTTLNSPETKIITIEDPVEYHLQGINQSQVDVSRGYTFSSGLRSIVRQDPDIVLVGEIRDLETAEIAIQASLTGHLVLSTIHTNSASGTIPRLLSMGAKSFLLAPSITAMVGQRLIRRICETCKAPTEVTTTLMERVFETLGAIPADAPERGGRDLAKLTFFKGAGCDACHGIGYKGRIGIYEVMMMTKEIEKMIQGGKVSEFDMQDIAIKEGMITMAQDGLLKALDGLTTIEEVFRVAE